MFVILASVTWGQGLGLALKTLGRPGPSATMNLERVSNEEKLNLCRKYYLGKGCYLRVPGEERGRD